MNGTCLRKSQDDLPKSASFCRRRRGRPTLIWNRSQWRESKETEFKRQQKEMMKDDSCRLMLPRGIKEMLPKIHTICTKNLPLNNNYMESYESFNQGEELVSIKDFSFFSNL